MVQMSLLGEPGLCHETGTAEANLENSREKEIYRGEGAAEPRLGTPRAQLGLWSHWQAGGPRRQSRDRRSTRRESFNRDRTDGRVGPGPAGGSCPLPRAQAHRVAPGGGGFKNTAVLILHFWAEGDSGEQPTGQSCQGASGSLALPTGGSSQSCLHTGSRGEGALWGRWLRHLPCLSWPGPCAGRTIVLCGSPTLALA